MTGSETAHDLVIVGGGPAGLTAGIYASRARMDVLVFEKGVYGGQMLTTSHIENYPGFPDGIGGYELADLMNRQAEAFGLKVRTGTVSSIGMAEGVFVLKTDAGTLRSRTVIVATGASPIPLGVPGEARLTGRGVSYCATCDGALYRDRAVAVVGGGDSAVEEAVFLTRFASRVHLIHRRDQLRAVPITAERALANPKIVPEWSTVVMEILGRDEVDGVTVQSVKTGEVRTIPVDGVFIYVGIVPQAAFLGKLADLDSSGYVRTDVNMMTSVPGLFAVGDVRASSIRQVASAVGDAATAAFYAYRHIQGE